MNAALSLLSKFRCSQAGVAFLGRRLYIAGPYLSFQRTLPLSVPAMQSSREPKPSSWPIEKYSYSISSLSNTAELQWTHFPHRDNLFLVIDATEQSSAVYQAYLKIIWSVQLLEELDLTRLVRQTVPALDSSHYSQVQPAILALGRSPCLAIKYVGWMEEEQVFRRFQVRFKSHDDYGAAKGILERAGCPVKHRPREAEGSTQALQDHRTGTLIPGTLNHFPQMISNSYGYPTPEQSQLSSLSSVRARDIFTSSSTVSSGSSASVGSSSILNLPGSYSTSVHKSSYHPLPSLQQHDDLPPPRRPSPLSSPVKRKEPTSDTSGGFEFLSSLPPLKKPTPVPKELVPPLLSGVSTTPAGVDRRRASLFDAGKKDMEATKGLDRSTRPNLKDSSSNAGRASHDIPGEPSKITENTKASLMPSLKRPLVAEDKIGSSALTANTREELVTEADEKEEEAAEFAAVENLIIEALDDPEFLKLLDVVGNVWQRIGFRFKDEGMGNFGGPTG